MFTGKIVAFADLFVRDNPNSWTFVMMFVTDVLIFLVVVGFPLRLLVYDVGVDSGMCFQFWIPIGVWLVLMAYRISLSLVATLRDPFKITEGSACDVFNLDGLIASTELALFCQLRAQFDNTARLNGRRHLPIPDYRRSAGARTQAFEPNKFKPKNPGSFDRQHARTFSAVGQ